jgi:hypothetical protein
MIVAPIAHCWVLKYVEGIFFEIGVPATSLLFFFRVKAVYNHSRVITAFFGILWLAIAGLTILVMLGIEGGEYPGYIQYDIFWITMTLQFAYHIQDAVAKALHIRTLQSQLFWPV